MRWLVPVVLAVATATAPAQSVSRIDLTTRAWNASVAAERQLGQVAAQRNALEQRRQDQLKTVDRLKNAPRSWRRDRELREALAEGQELGEQVERANEGVRAAQARLAAARTTLVVAIDDELATNPAEPRKNQLLAARAQVVPNARNVHRIVLPELKIDPLAEPEELDQQAQTLRTSEVELQNQMKGLESQAKELDRIAMLVKQHQRTKEMDSRDDNSSRRNAGGSSGGRSSLSEPAADSTAPGGGAGESASPPSFEMDATITLAEVVDPTTIDALNRAQRSNDPKTRADAARQARDAVSKKLAQVRAQRRQVEDRARQLRTR